MKKLKRNITIVTVLVFVCAAIYLNWSYNNRWGKADTDRVEAEDAAMEKADAAYEASSIRGFRLLCRGKAQQAGVERRGNGAFKERRSVGERIAGDH